VSQPKDQANRLRAMTDLGTTMLVEAGAGTGKTRILVERFINCLRAGAPLSAIVAITFTEKAAGDLRQRLTARLETLLGEDPVELQDSPPLDDAERERLQRALDDIDTAVVSTIHSFASRLLRERPVEAGIDPAFTQLDELGSELLLTRLWREWLEAGEEGAAAAGKPELAAALAAGVSLSAVQGVAAEYFGRRHSLAGAPPAPAFAAAAVVDDLHAWIEPMRAACACCLDQEDRLCGGMLRLADQLEALDRSADPVDLGWALVALKQRRTSYGGKGAGARGNWPGGKDDPLGARDEALDQIESAALCFSQYLADLTAAAARGFADFASTRQLEAGILDFDDLLGRARDLLAGRTASPAEARRVREFFQGRYAYLLVDEFQDTDPLQVEIVFLLCAEDPATDAWETVRLAPGKLFLVGDPKQSIYRFRDADIAIFQRVKQLVAAQGAVLDIWQNFRTLPGVVHWVNTAFSTIIGDVDEDLRPAYRAIDPWREDADERCKVTALRPELPLQEWKAEEVRAAEAELIAAFLAGLDEQAWTVGSGGQARPARLGDVTILLRTFTGIGHYERALRDAGVPYRVEGGKSFFQRPEVVDVLAGLRAVDVPGDELAVYAALHGMLFGFSDEELYAYYAAGGRFDPFAPAPVREAAASGIGEALALLRDLHEARTSRSISHVVDRLIRATNLLEVLAADGGGAQASGNLGKLIDLADAFSAEDDATFHAYVRKLGELQARSEEGESPVGEAGGFVRLISIHKAKGLEFPIVVLADTGAQPRSIAYNDVLVDRRGRRLLFGISVEPPDGTSKAERCQLEGDAVVRARETDAQTFEGRRLLYVAATRAMDRLVVPVVADAAPSRGSFLEQLLPFILEGDGPAQGVETVVAPPRPTGPRGGGEAPPADLVERRAAWLRDRGDALTMASRSAAITSPSKLELLDRPEQGTWEALPSNDDALALGQIVHRVMELAPLGGDAGVAPFAEVAAREERREDLAPRAAELAAACWWSSPVRDAAGRRHWKEVAVSASFDGILVEGYVDLLVETEDGLVVVDYKTDKDGDVGAAERRYALQLGAYAVALEAATGSTVTDAWVVMAAGPAQDGAAPTARIAIDDALRRRVREAAIQAAAAGLPLVDTLSR
jgi:ATP-dependent helicase/nuclease subunit A